MSDSQLDTQVEFRNVTYTIVSRSLLRGISLTLQPNSVTALLGRSGSGKTTLLRMVNGLVMPTSGSVLVGGKPTTEWDMLNLRRSIGYVIQESGLFPHMTISENVGLPLNLGARLPRGMDEYWERVESALAKVGLPLRDFGDRYPWLLSGGQRQRAGVARALVNDPGILLMDEPFGALDPITRAEMQTMVRDLLARVQKTVLLVTTTSTKPSTSRSASFSRCRRNHGRPPRQRSHVQPNPLRPKLRRSGPSPHPESGAKP